MQSAQPKIKTIYEMLYPYGDYNDDAALGCIAINRELRNLCKNNMRHVLLLVGRYLGHRFTQDTSTNDICKVLQDEILSICLGPGLSVEERAKVITGLKTGVTRPMTDLELGCQKFRNRYYNPFVALYTLRGRGDYWGLLYEYLRTRNDTEEEGEVDELEDWSARINTFEGWEAVLNMLKQGKFLEVFRMGLQETGGMISLQDATERNPLTQRDVDFLNYIVEGFLSGRFNVESTTWNDVCK